MMQVEKFFVTLPLTLAKLTEGVARRQRSPGLRHGWSTNLRHRVNTYQ